MWKRSSISTLPTGTITSYNGYATYLAIPETIGGAPVKAIGPEAFAQHTYLALAGAARGAGNHRRSTRFTTAKRWPAFTFPSTLKFIGDNAFYNAYKQQRSGTA